MHAGIGLQINSVIGDEQGTLPQIRGYMVGIDDEDYHTFGMKLSSRDDAHIADLYIVPSSDSAERISIIGRNSADNATRLDGLRQRRGKISKSLLCLICRGRHLQ